MYNCITTRWYTVVDETSVDEVSQTKCPQTSCRDTAFDTVNHNILLSKLERYEIRGIALEWFRNCLSNRYQQVACIGKSSRFKLFEHGVSQGSIPGPLLFLLNINDLPNSSTILHFFLFADDSNVFLSHSSYDHLINILNT